jgi:L-lysine 2,3-aminomutase
MLEPHQLDGILIKMEAARLCGFSENRPEEEIKKIMNSFRTEIREEAKDIQTDLKPHPSGQKEENVPRLDGLPVEGMQHKYRETVLFFPIEVCLSLSDSE